MLVFSYMTLKGIWFNFRSILDSLCSLCQCHLPVWWALLTACLCFLNFFYTDLQEGHVLCCKFILQSISDCCIFHRFFRMKMKAVHISHHTANYFRILQLDIILFYFCFYWVWFHRLPLFHICMYIIYLSMTSL